MQMSWEFKGRNENGILLSKDIKSIKDSQDKKTKKKQVHLKFKQPWVRMEIKSTAPGLWDDVDWYLFVGELFFFFAYYQ